MVQRCTNNVQTTMIRNIHSSPRFADNTPTLHGAESFCHAFARPSVR
jgi:hypothetical protein